MAERIVRDGGLINLHGWIHGPGTINASDWHARGISVVCSAPKAQVRDPFPPAIRLIHSGLFDLRPLVTHVVPLEEYPALLKRVAGGEETYVKGVAKME